MSLVTCIVFARAIGGSLGHTNLSWSGSGTGLAFGKCARSIWIVLHQAPEAFEMTDMWAAWSRKGCPFAKPPDPGSSWAQLAAQPPITI